MLFRSVVEHVLQPNGVNGIYITSTFQQFHACERNQIVFEVSMYFHRKNHLRISRLNLIRLYRSCDLEETLVRVNSNCTRSISQLIDALAVAK